MGQTLVVSERSSMRLSQVLCLSSEQYSWFSPFLPSLTHQSELLVMADSEMDTTEPQPPTEEQALPATDMEQRIQQVMVRFISEAQPEVLHVANFFNQLSDESYDHDILSMQNSLTESVNTFHRLSSASLVMFEELVGLRQSQYTAMGQRIYELEQELQGPRRQQNEQNEQNDNPETGEASQSRQASRQSNPFSTAEEVEDVAEPTPTPFPLTVS